MAGRGFDPHEIVDISSDSEDNTASGKEFEFFDAQSENQDAVEDNTPNELNAHFPANYHIADDGIIDLTVIPDVDVPPSDPPMIDLEPIGNDDFDRDEQIITEAVGLQMVLDFLPGISIDHVLGLLREKTTDDTRTNAHCRDLITQLVEAGDYPKEDDERNKKKRKRSDEDDWKDFEEAERDPEIPTYESDA
jgi:TRIAD3 protein (E3 ubiquitin-protein ligase RNF216)